MKTSVEISDKLLKQAKKLARQEGTTLRDLIERGLHAVLRESRQAGAFKLRKASFKGRGLHEGVLEGQWDSDLVYGTRGG